MNRRDMLKAAGSAAAITILGGVPLDMSGKRNEANVRSKDRKKILVIGGHPDDPETAAGGTMCLLTDAGHEVVSVYLTRGEAGIKGKSHAEAATIREAEAKAACKVTGARPLFLSQIDGSTEINKVLVLVVVRCLHTQVYVGSTVVLTILLSLPQVTQYHSKYVVVFIERTRPIELG